MNSSASNERSNLDDVARLAGVSAATASRALNGRSGVKPDVRTRVEMVANSIGYRPNRAAQRLAAGRSSVIALVMPSQSLQLDPYSSAIVQTVAQAAASQDQGLMVHLASEQPVAVTQRLIRDGQVDGVVLSALAIDEEWVKELSASGFPTVLIGYPFGHDDTICVDINNRVASITAVDHLVEIGRTRIAHIAGPPGRTHSADRQAGYESALRRHGLADAALVEVGDFSYRSGRETARALLDRDPSIDAIFAASDEMALGAIDVLRDAAISIPDDIAIVGFDGLRGADTAPSLTTIAQPFEELGRVAVELLLARISADDIEALRGRRAVVDAELIVRESTGGGSQE